MALDGIEAEHQQLLEILHAERIQADRQLALANELKSAEPERQQRWKQVQDRLQQDWQQPAQPPAQHSHQLPSSTQLLQQQLSGLGQSAQHAASQSAGLKQDQDADARQPRPEAAPDDDMPDLCADS